MVCCNGITNVLHMRFTGRELLGFDRKIPATCKVRNEENGERSALQVVYTMGSTRPWGLAYQPRPFPAGVWDITEVAPMHHDSEYWPFWIGTNARAEYPEWSVVNDRYGEPLERTFTAKGFGIHHARYLFRGELMASRTTLGCINILDPLDARWIGEEAQEAMASSWHIKAIIPPWSEWKL